MDQSRTAGRTAVPNQAKGNNKSKKPRKGKKKRLLIWLFFVALFGIVCAVIGYLLIILNGERILSANMNKLNLDVATIFVDRDGNQVSKMSVQEGNREFVPFNQIPKLVSDAFVATEDKRFYEHSGIDLLGIGRALVKDIVSMSAAEGASTITQQLAKNLFLNADKTLFRKGTEASIALALENHKSKEEILELYLNRIYFGKGQYGLKTAAKYYFNVSDLDKLEVWQIATLAGIPKAPNTYNPISNPEKSKDRRAVVLSLMYDQGLITEKQKLAAEKVEYNPDVVPSNGGKYLTFIDYALEEAIAKTGMTEEELLSSGLTIQTTIDTQAQSAMEAAFDNDALFEKSKDEIKVQGAMVIMDQHDGSLVAMVGGRDYAKKGWNRVTKQRQPGSTFKPIAVYGPAIETGKYYPWSTVQDVKQCFNNYCPTNSNSKNKYKGTITMAEAIKESRNISAVWLLNEIGVKTGFEFAGKLGIELDKNDRNLAMALGGLTYGVTPLQMVNAYGAFANGGQLEDPYSILSITDRKGNYIYTYKAPKAKRVMSEDTAYYVTELLKGVTKQGGTGVNANISGRTVAGKTGTTQLGLPEVKGGGNRDVWFVGYTPEWTAAVWFGYDSTDKDHFLTQYSGQAATMFSKVMSKALEGKKKQSFPVPGNLKPEQKLEGVTGFTATYDPLYVSVGLSWNGIKGDGITYKIYRKEQGEEEFSMYAEITDTVFDDMAFLPDQTLVYYVTAYQASTKLESDPSEQRVVWIDSTLTGEPPMESEPGGDINIEPTPSENPDQEQLPPIESPVESTQPPETEGGNGGSDGAVQIEPSPPINEGVQPVPPVALKSPDNAAVMP
ncbi:MAG: PBP1A family penicillin-binding protein [Candidatus Cohnella colombiensis]|uniref:PBP1A family penicillin-binding protein n=1 Tax=Candidatus Cohnella colombiensis TaxID=3121368 RepID=A0AA95EZN1_9BACL|nr:MAG: PBP1A family penicillin-binding protein [Cohnella sp.]